MSSRNSIRVRALFRKVPCIALGTDLREVQALGVSLNGAGDGVQLAAPLSYCGLDGFPGGIKRTAHFPLGLVVQAAHLPLKAR